MARFLKDWAPRIRVIAVDPFAPVFRDHFHERMDPVPSSSLAEGLGDEFPIPALDLEILDDVLQVPMGKPSGRRKPLRPARGLSGADPVEPLRGV